MADKTDEVLVSWVKLKGSNCPAYPIRATVAELPVFLAQLDPGDAILVSRPLAAVPRPPGADGDPGRSAGRS